MLDYPELGELIEQAQKGDFQSREQLMIQISPRVKTYIARTVLDKYVCEDIEQEVYFSIIRSLDGLKNPEAFWPWMYRIASNCINNYFRQKQRHQSRFTTFKDELLEMVVSDTDSAEARLMTRELAEAAKKAIATLKPAQRQVVVLRCFEHMSFKQISEVQQIKESTARVIFYRSLEMLKSVLNKQGFSSGSLVVTLTLFGRITASTEAAARGVHVTYGAVGTLEGSLRLTLSSKLAKLVAVASVHKTPAVVAATIILSLITGGAIYSLSHPDVRSVHFMVQGVEPGGVGANTAGVQFRREADHGQSTYIDWRFSNGVDTANVNWKFKGLYEHKLFMPEGPDGVIFKFMRRWSSGQENKLCAWLQDGSGNYYYDSADGTMYITNDPLRLLILPTDPPDYAAFLRQYAGFDSRESTRRKRLSKLMDVRLDERVPGTGVFKTVYRYNTLDKNDLIADWPAAETVVDLRDAVHRPGWSYFTISGEMDGHAVSGKGCLPFVNERYDEHPPWLVLHVGSTTCWDVPGPPAFISVSGVVRRVYEDEAFFTGFMKQWKGLACIDSIRRDVARFCLPFIMNEKSEDDINIAVKLAVIHPKIEVVYFIDDNLDIIKRIDFIQNGQTLFGTLKIEFTDQPRTYDLNDIGLERLYEIPVTENEFWLTELIR